MAMPRYTQLSMKLTCTEFALVFPVLVPQSAAKREGARSWADISQILCNQEIIFFSFACRTQLCKKTLCWRLTSEFTENLLSPKLPPGGDTTWAYQCAAHHRPSVHLSSISVHSRSFSLVSSSVVGIHNDFIIVLDKDVAAFLISWPIMK